MLQAVAAAVAQIFSSVTAPACSGCTAAVDSGEHSIRLSQIGMLTPLPSAPWQIRSMWFVCGVGTDGQHVAVPAPKPFPPEATSIANSVSGSVSDAFGSSCCPAAKAAAAAVSS